MKENLKKIKIFSESSVFEVSDLDDTSLEEYSKQLSNFLQSSKVSVLETSSGCLILRPSKIIGIHVTEEKRVKEKKSISPKVEVLKDEDRLEED